MTDIIANAPDEKPSRQPSANSGLRISGAPPAVAALARTLYAAAMVMPPDMFGAHAEVILRLATDPRMRDVWIELRRRSGGADSKGDYVHPAREQAVVHWPGYEGIRELAQQATIRDKLQEQAAALLFSDAAGFFLWDRRFNFGPRTITKAEIAGEIREILDLAQQIRKDRERLQALGLWRYIPAFEQAATDLDAQAQMRRPDPRNPYIVERRSSRVGDDWRRGFIIKMAMACQGLFGDYMHGTVATLGNVAYARDDLTASKVRGVLPAPNRS